MNLDRMLVTRRQGTKRKSVNLTSYSLLKFILKASITRLLQIKILPLMLGFLQQVIIDEATHLFFMRKLILESSLEEFSKIDQEDISLSLQLIKSFEILQFLRFDTKQFASICRIEFQNPSTKIEEIFNPKRIRAVILEEEKPGTYVCFLKERSQPSDIEVLKTGIYFADPFVLRDGKIKLGVVGETKQLRAFIKYVEKMKVNFTVVSSTDAKFLQHSPLENLTEKQRAVLTTAFDQGYYDIPRKISSQGLAKKLGLRGSTLIEHRRKAERRLIAGVINKS